MPDPRLTCLKTTPLTALHTDRYVCMYNIHSLHTCMALLAPRGLQGFFSKLLLGTKYCACFKKYLLE